LAQRLAAYSDPTLSFGETKIEYRIGSMKYESIARIALSHDGVRSVGNTRVRVVGLAPICPNAKDQVRDLCHSLPPFFLKTKFDELDVFELHNQLSPEWIDVAFMVKGCTILFLIRSKAGVKGSDRPVPLGDYVIVLEASGHNARPALGVFLIGDRGDELVFQRLPKPIGEVLGPDHDLARRFDVKRAAPLADSPVFSTVA
jgi:hypothetical protein